MAIDFQTDGMKDFQRTLKKYELASSKTRREVLDHRGQNFAHALFREANKVGRAAMKKIKALPLRRIKSHNDPNRSVRKEKARRIFAAGFVASGWIPAIKFFRQRGSLRTINTVDSPQGRVVTNYRKGEVTLINSTPGAAVADEKHGISDKAYRHQEQDMARYLERQAAKDLERSWR